jgi:outer membrane scaffolding protein for murein synthesis (MipA/OmpV family)
VPPLTQFNKTLATRLVITALTFAACSASAQEVARIPFFSASPGSSALGAGLRFGQSTYLATDNEDEQQLDLIPLYLFEGKYFFARGTAGGLHMFRNDALELNLYTKYRFQKLDPDSHSYYEGLEERDQTLDAGLELGIQQNWGEIKLSWVTDTLGNHNGQELQFNYRYQFDRGPWSISPYISWTWQDANLTNYYFGVSEAEARPDRPAYQPGESQWVGFGLNTAWHISDRIELFGNIGFAGSGSVVTNSPIVEEEGFSAAFVGGTYLFGNARKPDYIRQEDRFGEWSWRVNYGYQAEGNIVSEIDQGDFSKSTYADTNIAGLTLSKLLSEGERIDFLGKVAVFRHFESGEGNGNFQSYAAYISAVGRGFSSWSNEEWFRWSFGFGMSYATTIPIAEQRKQAEKNDNTSHFLNYLEMTVDFPLRRASKAAWLQNCYAGLTIVHRSGIFGTSDFLGDVSGGADWLTAHLECTR